VLIFVLVFADAIRMIQRRQMSNLYSLDECIWDWIQIATEMQKPKKWVTVNRHRVKREILAVLDGPRFQISTAEGFLNLVHPLILLRIAFDIVLTRSRVILF
jgi:hypothetical protein